MAAADRKALQDKLARTEAQLQDLERQCDAARARTEALRTQLTGVHEALPLYSAPPAPIMESDAPTPERIRLFRQLFRGREDVFACLWVNPKKQTKGYAPACANEWVRGVCERPRVKCGECSHQAFLAMEDQVILSHLQGRHVVGVYPMLRDETCWFLAADFDGKAWREDAAAFAETCAAVGLSPAVERSRSGNGAHCWFFFAAPMAASLARSLGSFLLTDVIRAIDQGRSPILLTERKDHLEFFAERLRRFVRHLIVLQGGMTEKERHAWGAQLEAIPDDEERLVLATGRYIGEGFDDARLDTLFLALPISWKGTLVQYTGRLHRPHARKTEVQIFDYVDRAVPVLLKMFERRLRAYRAIGYVQEEKTGEPATPPRDRKDESMPQLPGMPDQRR